MKTKLLLLLICSLGFISNQADCQVLKICDSELIDELEDFNLNDGIFIKSFSVSLPGSSKTIRHPTDSINIDLAGKSKYWIVLVSSRKKMGKAKLLMYDSNNSLIATIENKFAMTLDASEIKTDKPANYYFKVSFDRGFEGCAGFAIYYIPGVKIKKKS